MYFRHPYLLLSTVATQVLLLACLFSAPGRLTAAELFPGPLSFERNQGQTAPEVRYVARTARSTLFLTCSEAVLRLSGAPSTSVLRLGLGASSDSCAIEGLEQRGARSHYFLGRSAERWITDVPSYGRVRYSDVHPGVDLVFYGSQESLEYDFVLQPGADPSNIHLTIDGADRLSIDDDGRLIASLGGEQVVQLPPVTYQIAAAADGAERRVEVESRWARLGPKAFGFEVGPYDRSLPLVIDPVINYSTYLNGSGVSRGFDIAVDEAGAAYVVGETTSVDFPATAGAVQPAYVEGPRNAFIAKLAPGGNELEFATFLGGQGLDQAHGVAVDPAGNVYVIGDARAHDFPVTPGAFDTEPFGDTIFVAKLSPDGSQLLYSTFVADGGTTAGAIAVDAMGAAYITGQTTTPTFPVVAPVQPQQASNLPEVFVAKLNPQGSALEFATYWGGAEDHDTGEAIALGPDGAVYVAGHTQSEDFPTTPGAFQRSAAGTRDAFVLKLDPTGTQVVYSTLLGGGNSDWAYDIDVDVDGNAYIVGETNTTDGSFPVTPGAMKTEPEGAEGFVAKLNQDGAGLVYSTFVGGRTNDVLNGIAVDMAGHAYVTGDTTDLRFVEEINPVPGAAGDGPRANDAALFAKLRVDGSGALTLFGFGGGDGIDEANAIAVDQECRAYITGETRSKSFLTMNPFQPQSLSEAGAADAFVTKIDPSADNGEPTIGCRGVVHATATPTLREGSPGSIMSVFGRDFTASDVQALAPEIDSAGRVSTNLANTCAEVNGVRGPVFAALPGQVNFQNPHSTALGYASFRVIRGCGTANEQASEPERILIRPATPAFFNFVNNPDGVNPIAALHQDGFSLVGPPGLFGAAAETTPAAPGEFVSLFAGGFGATDPPFAAGEIPGIQAGLVADDVQVTIGGIPVPPEDILYIGVAPCCAGLYQLVVRIPPQAPTGNHAVIVTIQGRSSLEGPFVAVLQTQ